MRIQHLARGPMRAAGLLAWGLAALLFTLSHALADGRLLIVGGALDSDNAAVFEALIEALPESGALVILPVASGEPARSAESISKDLERHGFDPMRLRTFPLALIDDSSTEKVDEAAWRDNAWNESLVQALGEPAGFWLTGGDQMRITAALTNAEGQESPLLKLMRHRLAQGALVGGTSAGAAVMSRKMISGGNGFTSLILPPVETAAEDEDSDSGHLFVTSGLGFLPAGLVDQHFDQRARLGRLIRALAVTGETLGFGIDENTAMLVDLDAGSARVLGGGSVTLLDATEARFDFSGNALVRNLELGMAVQGARFSLGNLQLTGRLGSSTVGKEYYRGKPQEGGGMAFPNMRLGQALGRDLLDNQNDRLRRLSLDTEGNVLAFTFSQTRSSQGYWLKEAAGDQYNLSGIRVDIDREQWRRVER